ncbi:MAG: hypothetical protein IJD13_03825 [Oscillospiraceae bacterium]|nr:hypothetical protein [Oscillospiraceae bacterium]
MSFKKITEPDLAGLGVIGLPDAPGLSAAEMQAKMEEVVRSAVIPAFNRLIDELGAETAAGLLGFESVDGLEAATVQEAVEALLRTIQQIGEDTSEALSALDEKVESALSTSEQAVEESLSALDKKVTDALSETEENVSMQLGEMETVVNEAAEASRQAYETALSEAKKYIDQKVINAGSADMRSEVYDPQGLKMDVFAYAANAANAAAGKVREETAADVEALDREVTAMGEEVGALTEAMNGMAVSMPKISYVTATLTAAGWAAEGELFVQSVAAAGVTVNGEGFVTPAPMTDAGYEAYSDAGIRARQLSTDGVIVFQADEKPGADIALKIEVVSV